MQTDVSNGTALNTGATASTGTTDVGDVFYYDLPDETLEECIIKSTKADEEGDYEVGHLAETKALFMLLDAVRAGRDAGSIAGMAKLIDVAIKRENRGSRWFA